MQSISKNGTGNRLIEALAAAHITDVYTALTGLVPKHGRAVATWREGTGQNVAISNLQNVWYDHAANEGGGIIDLVMRVRGCSRRDAASWFAGWAGVPLDDLPAPPANLMRQRAREKRLRERDVPMARMWHEAAVMMAEERLHGLKTQLFSEDTDMALGHSCATPMEEIVAEIREWEGKLEHWRRLTDWTLVDEYRRFLKANPRLTSAMLHTIERHRQAREEFLRRAILGETE